MNRFAITIFSCLLLVLTTSAYFLFGQPLQSTQAAFECEYGSTQAQVQRDINDPWKGHVTITKGETFNVGSFHDGTGQFANDTILQVAGPGMIEFFGNGQAVRPPQAGEYTLYVNTRDQFGGGCSAQARVTVKAKSTSKPSPQQSAPDVRPTPVTQPQNSQCPYGSTQARVQFTIDHEWQKVIGIWRGDSFNVGSFHNHTGQFADDTKLVVKAYQRDFRKEAGNGERISPPGTGWYQLKVTTPGKTGDACEESAWVFVWRR